MPDKSFVGRKSPKVLQTVLKSLHGNPVREFRDETQRLKNIRIERATGVPTPRAEKPKVDRKPLPTRVTQDAAAKRDRRKRQPSK